MSCGIPGCGVCWDLAVLAKQGTPAPVTGARFKRTRIRGKAIEAGESVTTPDEARQAEIDAGGF